MSARKPMNWRLAAVQLARLIPREDWEPRVLAWAGGARPRARWAVGLSGGADSVALLLLLWANWPERRRQLRALHFNHRLRGAESRTDAVFCRRMCAALGIKFIAGEWKGQHRGASEADARGARMDFFAKHARLVWLGHQQDDVAETMLMRLARGSGAGGLSAPRPVQLQPRNRVHLRPLLSLKKAEIVAALRRAGIPWREDSSNARGEFFRNRVRRDVLPAWNSASERDALAGAARSRALLEEDDAALGSWLESLPVVAPGRRLALGPLAGKPRALVRRALQRWLLAQPKAGELSRQGFDALLQAVERGRPTRHSLGREGFAVIEKGALRFQKVGKARRKFQRAAN
ncbi:MAG: tRNA lysidine(34) synthetase TilS [Opitutus sp.]|nr:tRNA lysidine(34) synthetase TilS [Opitutus sp.]